MEDKPNCSYDKCESDDDEMYKSESGSDNDDIASSGLDGLKDKQDESMLSSNEEKEDIGGDPLECHQFD